jgi:hypothetical protein
MPLVYVANSAVGLDNVYDAFSTFMGLAGWTTAETVATRDKIFTSGGTDGMVNMVFRISASTAASNPFIPAYDVHKAFPWILVRGYNAWTVGAPGTGTRAYDKVGPWAFAGTTLSGGTSTADTSRIHRYNGTFPLTSSPDSAYLGRTRRLKTADSFETGHMLFDGRRKIIGPNTSALVQGGSTGNTQVSWSDIAHGESNFGSGGLPPGNLLTLGGAWALVHDAVNDKDLVFVTNTGTTLANQWLRYDIEANTWSTMAAPTWTASGTTAACAVWDGADTIYVHHGNGTTEFAKYSISGNSWTNLTASPVARSSAFAPSSSGSNTNMVYLPNGTVNGVTEDVIYMPLASTGTVIYRYDVTANAWRSTSGTGALTSQQTISSSFTLLWDRSDNKLIHHVGGTAPGQWFMSSPAVDPNVWTTVGSVQSAIRAYNGSVIVNHIPCKVRSHASQTTNYWFLGDADAVTAVVKINTATPHYYWMTFGRFSGSNRTDIMTATAPINPGGRVTVTVDDTSKYAAGEPILLWNPTNGNIERALIFDITGATTFRANIAGTYPTGTRIGIDPTQWFAGGNGFALCPTDPMGFGNDNESAQYVLEPLPDARATKRSSPGAGGLYQPVPISLFNDDETTAKYQTRGFIKNTFALSTGPYPALQSEEIVIINSKQYIFFEDTETKRYNVDTRGVLIGPIN